MAKVLRSFDRSLLASTLSFFLRRSLLGGSSTGLRTPC
jgi:hypothetical protein